MNRLYMSVNFVFIIAIFCCIPLVLFGQSEEYKEGVKKNENTTDELLRSPLPFDENIITGQFENGMKYYIQKNAKPENRAELRLVVNAGSMQEDEDQLGIAHFVEHMAFNGSKNFKKNELVDYLESVGARFGPDLNAYTSFDETVYMLQVRTDSMEYFDKGLLVLSDWASGLSFDHEEIDKERGVIYSEWRTGLSAEQRMQKDYLPLMYHKSRYAERLPIGDPKTIMDADYETIERFYRDWYRPDLMAVVVIGDIDPAMVEEKLSAIFPLIPQTSNKRLKENNNIPGHEETLISISTDKEATFSVVRLVYKHQHLPMVTVSDFRESLVKTLYNRMLNTRLEELTKTADPPFIFGYSGYNRDVGNLDVYTAFANVAEGEVASALEVLLLENERVLKHGFLLSELERQKSTLLERMERQHREKDKLNSSQLINRCVRHFLDGTPVVSMEDQLEFYKSLLPTITIEEVNGLASKWLTKENRVVIVTAPAKDDVPMPSEDELLSLVDKIGTQDISPYFEEERNDPIFNKELGTSDVISEKAFEKVGVKEFLLENDVRIVLKSTDFKNDEILMNVNSMGGTSLYEDKDFMNANVSANIVQESGVGLYSSTDLKKKLNGKSVNVFPFVSNYYEGLAGSCSPNDLELMLQLTHLYFTDPRKDEDAFKSFVARQSNIYKNLMSSPSYYFMEYTMKRKSNDHFRTGFPTVEKLQTVEFERALEIYRERFSNAADFTFFFVGNFDEATLLELAKKYLGTLPSALERETYMDRNIDNVKGELKEEIIKGEAPKAQVELFFHGPHEWNEANNYRFYALLDVLRIKLRESLREDKGGVYGVSVNGLATKVPGAEYNITISFSCDPEMTEELIHAALEEIAFIKGEGVDEKVINKVSEAQRQGTIKNLKENRYWMNRLISIYENEGNPTKISIEHVEEMIAQLDTELIKSAANLFFGSGNYIELVMKPEQKGEDKND